MNESRTRFTWHIDGFPRPATPAAVVFLFENEIRVRGGLRDLDRLLGGTVSLVTGRGEFRGRQGQVSVLHASGPKAPRRLVLVGLGTRATFTLEGWRRAVALLTRQVLSLEVDRLDVLLPEGKQVPAVEDLAAGLVESVILSQYRFDEHKTGKDGESGIAEFRRVAVFGIPVRARRAVGAAAKFAHIGAEATVWSRSLSNQPANLLTPTDLAAAARRAGRDAGFRVTVFDRRRMQQLGMGSLLGVARGSQEPPKFIIAEHRGARTPCVVLVGKGITFDSGGISLKRPDRMSEMKHDMSAGATVLAIVWAATRLALPIRLVGLVPATENLPDGRACKPGDVVRAMNGKSIEVVNTDAEGRLILADALCYAARYRPEALIDMATLTGACVTALGWNLTALFTRDEGLGNRIRAAAEATGEPVWAMPLWDAYKAQIRSDVADIKNSGGKMAGAITGSLFLEEFVGGFPWAHMDIAGTAWTDGVGVPYWRKGATGFGVRLFLRMLADWGSKSRAASSRTR